MIRSKTFHSSSTCWQSIQMLHLLQKGVLTKILIISKNWNRFWLRKVNNNLVWIGVSEKNLWMFEEEKKRKNKRKKVWKQHKKESKRINQRKNQKKENKQKNRIKKNGWMKCKCNKNRIIRAAFQQLCLPLKKKMKMCNKDWFFLLLD